MKNPSGIYPLGDRVLIKPDDLEEITEGGIVIPAQVKERTEMAQSIGTVVALGPDCYVDYVEKDGSGSVIRTRGFSKAFCKEGDRVCFGRYAGLVMPGKDGGQYRLINDTDITAIVDEGVDFNDWSSRKAVAEQ